MTCPDCGAEHSSSRLDCPVCRRLVHREELEQRAREAEDARAAGRVREEVVAWRRALELLPPESEQSRTIAARVEELSAALDAGDDGEDPGGSWRSGKLKWAGLGTLALLVWKLKSVVAFIVTKGKFLIAGLTKSSTFLSMFLSLGVYWTAFGWQFALGLVVSIYIHEMGHVAALHRFGIAASAPMFVPGIGALVRMSQYPVNAREDARIGLAGPIYGLGAAIAAYGAFAVTGLPIWGAIARIGAWINLFNLIPVWQLDGARGFRALSKGERLIVTGLAAALFFWAQEGMLLLVALACGVQAFRNTEPEGDRTALIHFAGLLIALSALTGINVPL